MEAQKVTELTIEEEDKEHLHLPRLPQGALLLSSRLDSAVKHCSSEVILQRGCSVKGLARRD